MFPLAPALVMPLVMTLAGQAFARDEYSRNIDKTATLANGQSVRVEHRMGNVNLRTHAGRDVVVRASIRVSASNPADAKRLAEQIQVEVATAGSALVIRTEYPKEEHDGFFGFHGLSYLSYSVNLDVTMPETAPLELHNSFGSVGIEDLKANADVINAHGKLTFRNGRGAQHLENQFAAIEVTGNAGDVDIRNSVRITNSFGKVTVTGVKGNLVVGNGNGDVEANNVTGSAELNTSFGAVRFGDIGKVLSVRAANSAVIGRKVGESATIENSFGKVDISEVHKGIRIVGGNSPITVADVGEEASLKTSFGLVTADRVGGPLTVEDNNGAVKASALRNNANVKTSFGAVLLDGVAGAVDVDNQNGGVEVSLQGQACKPVGIHTSFSPVRVRVPNNASYAVAAKTSFGKIHSDFPMTVSGDLGSDSLNGNIGGGGCPMRLTNNNGSIEILK
ncbi:MAG: hypothetical protein ABSF54_10525 [Bryobacteraceae bacterium]